MGPQFHETRLGRTFYEHQLPSLLRAVPAVIKLADSLAKLVEQSTQPDVVHDLVLQVQAGKRIVAASLEDAAKDDQEHADDCTCGRNGYCWQREARTWLQKG